MNSAATTMVRPTVMGCGLVAWDVVMDENRSVAYAGVGGTVGNVLAIMARLGWRSVPVIRLGADQAGMRVLEELTSLGVDTSRMSLDRRLRTPVVYQFNGVDQGQHSFSFRCPQCGTPRRFQNELIDCLDSEAGAPPRGHLFIFDRLSPSSVDLAERARANGGLVVFEPSAEGHDRALFHRALRATHVVKYSAERLSGFEMPALREGFVEIQTLGAQGLRFRMHSLDPSWVNLPAISVGSVVDTAGAGDWCTAGFLHLLGRQMVYGSPADLGYNRVYAALRGGQTMAAFNCRHVGARGLMRHWDSANLLEVLNAVEGFATSPLLGPECVNGWPQDLGSELGLYEKNGGESATPSVQSSNLCCDAFLGSYRNTPNLQ